MTKLNFEADVMCRDSGSKGPKMQISASPSPSPSPATSASTSDCHYETRVQNFLHFRRDLAGSVGLSKEMAGVREKPEETRGLDVWLVPGRIIETLGQSDPWSGKISRTQY